jgi:hypothetical protein
MKWSESDYKELRNWLHGVLTQDSAVVTFVKRDGTLRRMHCTLNGQKYVIDPPKLDESTGEPLPKSDKSKRAGPIRAWDHMAVWDLDANAWRSFKVQTIRSVELSLGDEE